MKSIDISGPSGVSARVSPSATPLRGSDQAPRPPASEVDADRPVLSVATAGASPPVDAERVAEIRRAIEQDRYPVIPFRVADAMIAAGLLLRTK